MPNKMQPIHPGKILREEMDELELSANALAKALNVPANRITAILNEQRSITGDTALRLAKYFDTTPEFWMNLQTAYDVKKAMNESGKEIERNVSGQSLARRLEIALDMMCDYLFSHPEVPNLILFGYFSKTRHGVTLDIKMSEHIANIAVAMDMAKDKKQISIQAQARILAVWNTVLNFISAESLFRPMLDTNHENYMQVVKDTLKFILVPAFTSKNA